MQFYLVRHYTKLLTPSPLAMYAELPGQGGRRIALQAKPDGSGWEKEDLGKDEVKGHDPKRPYFVIPGAGAVDESEMADLVATIKGRAAAGEGAGSLVPPQKTGAWWMEKLYRHRYEKWAYLTGRSQYGYGGHVQRDR
jgi:hypothetical protein